MTLRHQRFVQTLLVAPLAALPMLASTALPQEGNPHAPSHATSESPTASQGNKNEDAAPSPSKPSHTSQDTNTSETSHSKSVRWVVPICGVLIAGSLWWLNTTRQGADTDHNAEPSANIGAQGGATNIGISMANNPSQPNFSLNDILYGGEPDGEKVLFTDTKTFTAHDSRIESNVVIKEKGTVNVNLVYHRTQLNDPDPVEEFQIAYHFKNIFQTGNVSHVFSNGTPFIKTYQTATSKVLGVPVPFSSTKVYGKKFTKALVFQENSYDCKQIKGVHYNFYWKTKSGRSENKHISTPTQ